MVQDFHFEKQAPRESRWLSRKQKKKFSVASLRRESTEVDGEEQNRPRFDLKASVANTFRPVKKKIWWKLRNYADSKGFPQEFTLEEYAERRAKDEKRFAEEFPSIIWQENRQTKIALEKEEREREVRRAQKKELIRAEERRKRQLHIASKRKTEAKELERRIDIEDHRLDHVRMRDLERIAAFEEEERYKAKQALESQAKREADLEAEMLSIERARIVRERIAKEEEEKKVAQEEDMFEQMIEKILVSSGTKQPKTTREKDKVHQGGTLLVRYNPEVDEKDANLQVYNIWPLAEYSKESEGARDCSKKFPQFFSPSVTQLVGRQLGEAGAVCLAKVLSVGGISQLRELRLGYNDIRFKGLKSVMTALADGRQSKLQHLNLSGNNIGDQGAEEIARALRANKRKPLSLQTIDLSCNRISDAGAFALTGMLLNSTQSLVSIRLGQNQIGASGAKSLVQAAKSAKNLTLLVLRNNRVELRDAQRLSVGASFLEI